MPWTTPRTWVALEVVTASIMNTHVRDNLLILKTSINDDGSLSGISDQLFQARLSLTTGDATPASDVTGATTLYLTPYNGNKIRIYNLTNWVNYTLSADLTLGTGGLTASRPHDIFLDYNAGSPQLVAVAWSSDSARTTALTTQDGIYVRTANADHLYVGTIWVDGSTQFNDSHALRYVWNMYNRIPRPMRVFEATDSWTYTTATWRQSNGSTSNEIAMVVGLAGQRIYVSATGISENGARAIRSTAIGEDSTSSPMSNATITAVADLQEATGIAIYGGFATLGRHRYVWLERSEATSTTTWYGDGGGDDRQSGIQGCYDG